MFCTAFEVSVLLLILLGIYLVFNWLYRSIKIDKKAGDLYVLITGCDTGFGNRCAHKLDQQGFHVFAACLTDEKVKELASSCSERLVSFQMDVTDETNIKKAFDIVREHLPAETGLWAIVNNAGIMGSFGICEWLKKSHYEATLNVNVLGMISVTRIFLPLVRKAKGRIINTASVLGRVATPPAAYGVSKFCVRGFTDSLRREMAQEGISVHTIEPGGYNTNITNFDLHKTTLDSVYDELDDDVKEFYGDDYKERIEFIVKASCMFLSTKNLDEVADTYIHAITAKYPKTRYVVGLNGNLVFRFLWTIPTWMADLCFYLAFPVPKGLK